MDSGAGPLVYSVGLLKNGTGGSAPTSITWSTTTDIMYSNGCYPSIALSFDGYTPPNQNGSTSNLSCGSKVIMSPLSKVEMSP
jgi:hypothetical protein